MEQYFEFELTLRPQALFKNDLMRKPDESSLRKIHLTVHMMCLEDDVNGVYVLDGGALLHRVHWIKGARFKEVILAYVNYVRKNYGNCFIVLDGYESATSIKSNEHARGVATNGSSPDITIREDNEVPYSKERFLANTHNKTQIISFISDNLTEDGQKRC